MPIHQTLLLRLRQWHLFLGQTLLFDQAATGSSVWCAVCKITASYTQAVSSEKGNASDLGWGA